MKIRRARKCVDDDHAIVTAEVQADGHAPLDIRIAAPRHYADWVTPTANAFLLAAAVAAGKYGDRTIELDAPVCPQLRDGINVALRLMRHEWPEPDLAVPEVEAPLAPGRRQPGTACFLSGGVDSMAALRHNVTTYPADHPHRIRTAFFVYGLDIGDPNKAPRTDLFDDYLSRLREVAADVGVEMVPVWTNIRDIMPDWRVYERLQFASLLAAIGHVFSAKIGRLAIALDNTTEYVFPHGSQPRLNACYSSSEIEIVNAMERYSRLDKVRLIADWDVALRHLRVCWMMQDIGAGAINCGTCSKCVRTLAELLVAGAIDRATAFPVRDLRPESFASTEVRLPIHLEYYPELVEPLRQAGRPDLAAALQARIDASPLTPKPLWYRAARSARWRARRAVRRLSRH
ncbi:MAG: hypothetical protein RIM84_25760 [Alphaproteobacteria bacterium]